MMIKKVTGVLITLFAATALGCGVNVKAGGKVSFDSGEPLTRGSVVFTRSDGSYQVNAAIKEDGTYDLNEDGKGAGIQPGEYQVSIIGAKPVKDPYDRKAAEPESLIDKKYANRATSGLSVTVEAGSPVSYDIIVTAPKKNRQPKSLQEFHQR
ncbi:MAG: hypothetical protein Q4G68_02200 [Planctomycetia bacterium]|nr:hypothetical protein [Planctomycetia bacterium]